MSAPRRPFAWVEHSLVILAGWIVAALIAWARVEGLL